MNKTKKLEFLSLPSYEWSKSCKGQYSYEKIEKLKKQGYKLIRNDYGNCVLSKPVKIRARVINFYGDKILIDLTEIIRSHYCIGNRISPNHCHSFILDLINGKIKVLIDENNTIVLKEIDGQNQI